MKDEKFRVFIYAGLRLKLAQWKERRHAKRMSRPVTILNNIKID